ncbi:hypothetical protein D9V41_02185 [Aeromicrobium phragmitis]|uniref:Choice-of-anchor G family protein n=1 Tax=Aeromicrobium phragmitis TaxID=2478914 RepID=A0A3L8PTX2_9ACTN|nr:choice-of-anchor G family protein [Aeromicrobium phragmitis]RLV57462.1 hypothetical protein D9V41_02185 [Aeromicrobium phragmitis]
MAAVGTAAALVLSSAGPVAAAEGDDAQAEGRVLTGSAGTLDLDTLAALRPAFVADPNDQQVSPLAVDVLSTLGIDLGGGIQLFGPNGVIGVGALGQVARTSDTTASAASGAVTDEGAIAVGGNGVGDEAYVDLTALLSSAGVADVTAGLVDQLRLDLGVLSATAQAKGGEIESDYQISGGRLTLRSPAVTDLTAGIDEVLGTLSDTANDVLGPQGALDSSLSSVSSGLVEPLTTALNTLSLGLVSVDDVNVAAAATVDVRAALSSVTSSPLTDTERGVTIDLSRGTIEVDLAKLITYAQGGTYDGTLNNLAPNTEILDPELIKTVLDGAIGMLLDQVPALVVNAATDALNSTELTVHLTANAEVVAVVPVPLATIDIKLAGPIGGFLGLEGATAPNADTSETKVLGGLLPVDELLEPVLGVVTGNLLPALVQPLQSALSQVGIVASVVEPVVSIATTALDPLAPVLNQLLSVTANVQQRPGAFTQAGGVDAGSFTQRALSVRLLPGFGTPLAEVNLASATVRAGVVEGTDPEPDPEPGTDPEPPGTDPDGPDGPNTGGPTPGNNHAGGGGATTASAAKKLPAAGADLGPATVLVALLLLTGGSAAVMVARRSRQSAL